MDTVILTIGAYDISAGWAIAFAIGAVFIAFIVLLVVLLRNNRAQIEAAAEAEKNRLAPQFKEKDRQIEELKSELAQMRQTHTSLSAQNTGLKVQLQEQAKQNTYVQEQMQGKFKLLAEDVLTSQSEKFSRQNREQVDSLLKPLREKITEFQKQSHEGAAQLAQQMKTLTQDSLRMSEEATNLTRALKGSSQVQGAWGEMILSNILEKSGLVEGEQFLTQQSHIGEGGARVRTDVEIMFPNGDKMVIDSKVSLVAFEAYCNGDDEELRAGHLREHIASIKAHIKTLGEKDYQVHSRSGFDFVMMFVPIEAAFSTAFEADSSLIDFAMKKNVYITTPTTLMVALRTVRNVWDIETRNKNAEIIAERAGHLYDKVSGFLASMDKLDKSLMGAQKSFDEAKSQLTSGRGSVVRQVEMLQKLGAKANKPIPPSWEEEGGNSTPEAEEFVPEFLSAPEDKPAK